MAEVLVVAQLAAKVSAAQEHCVNALNAQSLLP
jgi:hypothetical protein